MKKTRILPNELIKAKMSVIKCQYDITRPENSDNFRGYLRLHQNTTTKQFKIRQKVKTNFGMNSIARQHAQKWNRLPECHRLVKNENLFKKTLNVFCSHSKKRFF